MTGGAADTCSASFLLATKQKGAHMQSTFTDVTEPVVSAEIPNTDEPRRGPLPDAPDSDLGNDTENDTWRNQADGVF